MYARANFDLHTADKQSFAKGRIGVDSVISPTGSELALSATTGHSPLVAVLGKAAVRNHRPRSLHAR
jgi:hypothetical protein